MLRIATYLLVALACLAANWGAPVAAQEPPADAAAAQQKNTFVDHVLPIFRARCGACHNSNDRKGSLVLDSYAGVTAGGSSGEVVAAGDPSADALWKCINHDEEPFMPMEADKLPEAQLDVVRKWIQQGLLEKSSSVAKPTKTTDIGRGEVTGQRPAEVAMPQGFLGEAPRVTPRANSVTALAISPWAPLAAVSGQEQIALYNTRSLIPLGFLPFPEGQPQILKFSRNGKLLLAGGGHSAASGRVVVYDVKTGRRLIEIGDEYDTVLAADISADQSLIALGGPKRMLRVYSVAKGELVYESNKHTDWVTAIEFSPDGVLLASGDRGSGLFVWEAGSGHLFHDLTGHRGAISDVSWRADSNALVSASEDGALKLWGMEEGNQIKSWNAHGGVTAVEFVRDGRIVSIGRDKRVRLWKADGSQIREFAGLADIGLEVAFDAETERVFGGDWTGQIRVWDANKGDEVGQLSTNPPTMAAQIRTLETRLAESAAAPASEGPPEASSDVHANQLLLEQLRALEKASADSNPAAVSQN